MYLVVIEVCPAWTWNRVWAVVIGDVGVPDADEWDWTGHDAYRGCSGDESSVALEPYALITVDSM